MERFRFKGKKSTSSIYVKDPPTPPPPLKKYYYSTEDRWKPSEKILNEWANTVRLLHGLLHIFEDSGSLSVARHISASCESPGIYVRKELCRKRGRHHHPGGELEGFLYSRKRIRQWSAAFINLQRWQATCKKTQNKLTDTSILKAGFSVYVEHVGVFWHQIQQEGGNRPSCGFPGPHNYRLKDGLAWSSWISDEPPSLVVLGAMAESKRQKFLKTTPPPSNVIGLALPSSVPQRCGKRDVTFPPFRPCCCLTTSSLGVWQWSRKRKGKLPEDCDQKLCFPTMIRSILLPELLLCTASIRQVYIIKLIAPWESSVEEAYECKKLKDMVVAAGAQQQWRRRIGSHLKILTKKLGARGRAHWQGPLLCLSIGEYQNTT